jgi:signal peptidase II
MRLGLLLAAVVAILDQLTKWLIIEKVMRPEGVWETPFYTPTRIEIGPYLEIVMAWNRGVSFGIFSNDGMWNVVLLSGMSLLIVTLLVVWMRRAPEPMVRLALGLVVGGALGNVVDRIRFGAVADFIYLHWNEHYWPAFNLADSAITVGACVLVLDSLFAGRQSSKN